MSRSTSLSIVLGAILLFTATMLLDPGGQVGGLNVMLSVLLAGVGLGGLVRSIGGGRRDALPSPDLEERIRQLEEQLHVQDQELSRLRSVREFDLQLLGPKMGAEDEEG